MSGSSLVELALLLPVLILLFVGTIDFGRAWYVDIEVVSAAEAGALYGIQNSADLSGMKAAALLDATDISNLTANPTYGVECTDGSASASMTTNSASISCPSSTTEYVQVDTSATYKTILNYPSIPSSIKMSASVRLRTGN